MTAQPVFDPFHSQIAAGVNLIEASAGTGKTFSIAMLVLRGIVERGLTVDQILVVTFTRAATEELRQRIRQRLTESRSLLRDESGSDDDKLREFLDRLDARDQVLQRLETALLDIDRMAIVTIHAFCQSVLQDLALESGQPFDLEVIADIAPYRDQLVKDFWRFTFYPLDARFSPLICSFFPSPNELYGSISGLESMCCDILPDQPSLASVFAELDRLSAALEHWWEQAHQALAGCLDAAIADGFLTTAGALHCSHYFKGLSLSMERKQAPLPAEIAWLIGMNLLQHLSGKRLRSQEKKLNLLSDWPLPGAIADRYLETTQRLQCVFRRELVLFLRTGLRKRLERHGVVGFNDLITGLAEALNSTAGPTLCREIGTRFNMILIDEFQDTDSAQWSIFSKIFGSKNHLLYLIGDPKQAIYRFRGADIHSYYVARRQADRFGTLTANFRSHPGLMQAVNKLFADASFDGQPYHPISPARSPGHGRLLRGGRDVSGLAYCHLKLPDTGDGWSKEAAREVIATWIVGEVLDLLGDHGPVVAVGETPQQMATRCLEPSDIAILVRSNQEAAMYQEMLRRCAIPVVITSKQSVFSAPACVEMIRVLRAISQPGDEQSLKTALGASWFVFDGADYWQLCDDEAALAAVQERFHNYNQRWQEHGFLPMFFELLREEQVLRKIGQLSGAERRIADIMHLAELVQEQQTQYHLTPEQCVSWLQQATEDGEVTEQSQLRLEHDDASLQVITMHSAKGLEFPVVFCPSLLDPVYRQRSDQGVIAQVDGRRICDLGSDQIEKHRQLSLVEEEEESMRLAYVAVTRATLCCYLLWAEIKAWRDRPSSFAAPLGRLLFPDGLEDSDGQTGRLQAWGNQQWSVYRLVDYLSGLTGSYERKANRSAELHCRYRSDRALTPSRLRTSFSGLAKLTQGVDSEYQTERGAFDEISRLPVVADEELLPSGVRFGSAVHELLETHPFVELADGAIAKEAVQACCRRFGCTVDTGALIDLLRCCVTTPLIRTSGTATTFRLVDLHQDQLVKEMNFTLRLERGHTHRINDLLAGDPCFLPLSPRQLSGFLTGFIDLVGCFNDRYYIIDYKTNRLGNREQRYDDEALTEAMRSHNYGLQYWLYTVALHRYLSRWLPGYSFDKHVGGIFYLFVRGMRPDKPGEAVFSASPDERTVRALDRCFFTK